MTAPAGQCLLCGGAAEPGSLFDSPLCRSAWRETRRLRFAEHAQQLPRATADALEALITGHAEENERIVDDWLRRPEEK